MIYKKGFTLCTPHYIIHILILFTIHITRIKYSFIFTAQIHSLEREALQVSGVRQRLLSIPHAGRPQDSTHGGITAQVPRLQSQLQSAFQFENTPSHAHRHQTVSLYGMWQSFSTQLRFASPFADAQSGGAQWPNIDNID